MWVCVRVCAACCSCIRAHFIYSFAVSSVSVCVSMCVEYIRTEELNISTEQRTTIDTLARRTEWNKIWSRRSLLLLRCFMLYRFPIPVPSARCVCDMRVCVCVFVCARVYGILRCMEISEPIIESIILPWRRRSLTIRFLYFRSKFQACTFTLRFVHLCYFFPATHVQGELPFVPVHAARKKNVCVYTTKRLSYLHLLFTAVDKYSVTILTQHLQ